MRKSIVLLSYCFIVLLFLGCEKLYFFKPKEKETPRTESAATVAIKGTVIAKVNNMPIILEDLNQEVDAFNAIVKDKPETKITTREQKINYLKNEMVQRALLYQEALDRGLDRKEEIQRTLEKTKQEFLVMELIREEAGKVEVSPKDIEDYYNLAKDQLKDPEERQIREILVLTESESREILIQLLQGQDFAALAKERSKLPSAKDGGDLGFISKGQKFPQFDTAAFSDALEIGKVSNIFKGPDGYYILKLEARRGGKQRSLSEMWDDIKRALTFVEQQKRIEDLIAKLSSKTKIELYETEIK